MDINKDIGARLRKTRKLLKLSLKEFEKETTISTSMVSAYERGENPISEHSYDLMELHLNINRLYIKEGKGERFIKEDYSEFSDIHQKTNDSMPPSYSNESIEQLIEQNSELVKQVSDLIKMQLLNAESIRNLSTHHVRHQDRKGNTG